MTVRSVVLDANIYVSALVFGGKPKRALQLAITGRVHASVSEPIRNEVRRTLRNKFRWSDERVADADGLIGTAATSVVPTVTLKVIERDPDDDRVLGGSGDHVAAGASCHEGQPGRRAAQRRVGP